MEPVEPRTVAESDVFKGYTSRSKRVLVMAQEEARRLKLDHISPDHLLLGLLSETSESGSKGLGVELLESLGINIDLLYRSTLDAVGEGKNARQGTIPFTESAKAVLLDAYRESLLLGHNHTGTEHILLGLIRAGSSRVTKFNLSGEIVVDAIRREVLRREGLVGSLAIRALTRARMSALAARRRPDDIDLLAALLHEIGQSTEPLPAVVAMLAHLKGRIPRAVRELGTRPLRDVLSAAAVDEPDERQLLAALAEKPSRAYAAVIASGGFIGSGDGAQSRSVRDKLVGGH